MKKLTKRAQIQELYEAGKTTCKQILAELPGSSPSYIRVEIWSIENPGKLKAAKNRWATSEGGRTQHRRHTKNWRQEHPDQVALFNKRMQDKRHEATRPHARNHRQIWTDHDLKYLEAHGQKESVHEMALVLGRTDASVRNFSFKHKINMRGDKMGIGARRFMGTYDKPVNPKDYPSIA